MANDVSREILPTMLSLPTATHTSSWRYETINLFLELSMSLWTLHKIGAEKICLDNGYKR